MRKSLFVALAAFVGVVVTQAQAVPPPPGRVAFVYHDFDRFVAAHQQVEAGAPAAATFQAYVDGGSPPYPFYRNRYGATGQSIAEAVAKRPKHYRQVAALRSHLKSQEPIVERGVKRLQELFPDIKTPPVYFLVGNMIAGGIHATINPPVDGQISAPAVLVEVLAMSPETDMSEWPGQYGGGYLEDIGYAAVHEMVHAYQARIQGLENYVSIYQQGKPGNIYLALAMREGCADFITRLAIGRTRKGKQEEYGLQHERELWAEFGKVMHAPASFEDGWFGALDPKTPDWPPQIGYWVGQRICAAYHAQSVDKSAALKTMIGAYTTEHFRLIAAPYAARMEASN